jgi:transcription antitermination factor NusG
MVIDATRRAGVGTGLPVASHEQNHKHGAPEHTAYRAGWYILRCGAGTDFPAADAVRKAGFKVFVPCERKWRVSIWRRKGHREASKALVEYPRFPSYLFVHITPPVWPYWRDWPLDRYITGILALDGQPARLAAGEMERLQADDGTLVPHDGSMPTHKAFMVGMRVRVMAGAFQDFTMRIDAIDDSGAHGTVPIFGRLAAVTLPLTWLEAA